MLQWRNVSHLNPQLATKQQGGVPALGQPAGVRIEYSRRISVKSTPPKSAIINDGKSTSIKNRRGSTYIPEDPLLSTIQSATETGRAVSTFLRDVKCGRLPPPYYITPRCPRWRRSELRAAIDACRAS